MVSMPILLFCLQFVKACVSEEDVSSLRIDLSHLNQRAFGLPSEKSGERLSEWDDNSEYNPEEMGEYAEGDILFPNFVGRNGLKAESTRWPGGVIPFEIRGDYDAFEMATIESALDDYHNLTCLKFVPRTKEKDYISITSGSTGCWSSVGRVGGKQKVNLQSPGCLKRRGTVIHELMHAVGFLHEQNRWERDDYVQIIWKNVQRSHEHNFEKAQKNQTNDFNVPYDYGSVMHYSGKAFSINGQSTILPKKEGVKIGQREGFSARDIHKINKMYKCATA